MILAGSEVSTVTGPARGERGCGQHGIDRVLVAVTIRQEPLNVRVTPRLGQWWSAQPEHSVAQPGVEVISSRLGPNERPTASTTNSGLMMTYRERRVLY
jgi:hypothetical protein